MVDFIAHNRSIRPKLQVATVLLVAEITTAAFEKGSGILFSVEFWASFAEAGWTSAGFFWKSGWAFVLGYFISAMIQAFVPKGRLTPYLGGAEAKSVGLATAFGTNSSSCSFAALAAARALVMKGAHFVAAVAFMFASTNLVIELGILILIFLGWQFLAAEIVGGLVLIIISRQLVVWTYPKAWLEKARQKVEEEAGSEEESFDWRRRIRSAPEYEPKEFAKGLYPAPPSLTSGHIQEELREAEIYWILKHGIKMAAMPTFSPTHDEQELWGLVALAEEMLRMPPEQYRRQVQTVSCGHGHTHEESESENDHGHGSGELSEHGDAKEDHN